MDIKKIISELKNTESGYIRMDFTKIGESISVILQIADCQVWRKYPIKEQDLEAMTDEEISEVIMKCFDVAKAHNDKEKADEADRQRRIKEIEMEKWDNHTHPAHTTNTTNK